MSLPTYPRYKNGDAAWLGLVPAHWTVKRMRFAVELNPSKSEISTVARDTEVSFLPMEAIGDDGSLSLERTRPVGAVESGYTYFRDGDVAVAKITPCFENGKGALMRGLQEGIGFGTTELIVARPRAAQTSGAFVNWIFRSPGFRKQGEASMYGAGGQKRVPDDFVRNISWAFPPSSEQVAITAFLDRETGKIDALIAEQEKLLTLLVEKRRATISHAVTRGLNPDAPMKDSGAASLGEVPAHWQVKRLKTISPSITVGIVVNPSDYISDGGLPFIYGGDISEGNISLESCRRISPEGSNRQAKTKLEAGDLLTVRVGAPGVTAVVPESCAGGNCASVMLIRRGRFESEWLCYAMNSRMVRYQVEVVQYGAAQEQFNIGHAINFWVATPPACEQAEIADFLNRETTKLDTLNDAARHSIDLLKERRSALISAAVTGKIDVRGAVPSPVSKGEELAA
ncbi:restriction endonuclease subunit S [Paraburkholderia sp. BCC1876]|uniref:restriction endonuclease subunit S n=1 Tax=Paraburkholderia sp. BCC1876 TaxID=2676303 RepID=UPI001591D617|nr:restriction endonuclease subunit S [Paraburkholderia sp. BCC1876]